MELSSGQFPCYSGTQEKKEHGVGFLLHREIAGKLDDVFSISERVPAVVIKLNKRYGLKTYVQAYAPTTSYHSEYVDSFYEDVESAIKKATTQFTIVTGDFIAKVGKKQTR